MSEITRKYLWNTKRPQTPPPFASASLYSKGYWTGRILFMFWKFTTLDRIWPNSGGEIWPKLKRHIYTPICDSQVYDHPLQRYSLEKNRWRTDGRIPLIYSPPPNRWGWGLKKSSSTRGVHKNVMFSNLARTPFIWKKMKIRLRNGIWIFRYMTNNGLIYKEIHWFLCVSPPTILAILL